METLTLVCNLIIIIGGAFLAIKNIAELIGKPIRFFRKKSDKELDTKIHEEVQHELKTELPEMLFQHDKERDRANEAARVAEVQTIKTEVLNSIHEELEQFGRLSELYEPLVISAKDMLREKIMHIYRKHYRERSMSQSEKEALDQYYLDYKSINGNSYITKYYGRMSTWTVVPDDYDANDGML